MSKIYWAVRQLAGTEEGPATVEVGRMVLQIAVVGGFTVTVLTVNIQDTVSPVSAI